MDKRRDAGKTNCSVRKRWRGASRQPVVRASCRRRFSQVTRLSELAFPRTESGRCEGPLSVSQNPRTSHGGGPRAGLREGVTTLVSALSDSKQHNLMTSNKRSKLLHDSPKHRVPIPPWDSKILSQKHCPEIYDRKIGFFLRDFFFEKTVKNGRHDSQLRNN